MEPKDAERYLPWEQGVIARLETFFIDRYPIGQMWARALATSLTSTFLYKVVLEDEMGPVRPNIWFSYVARSGLGCKSPPLYVIRRWVGRFAPALLAPAKFTPEGMTEYICGRKARGDEEEVSPHPANLIIRDEVSRMLTERTSQSAYHQLWEYLSDLWDGFVEGVRTRKYGYEGNVNTYVVFLAASSNIFFKNLDEDFFVQGLGNRLLWVVEDPPAPRRIDPETFFFPMGGKDEGLAEIEAWLIRALSSLTDVQLCFIAPDARVVWANFAYSLEEQIGEEKSIRNRGEFLAKQKLNSLKLAMIYAASHLNITKENVLLVTKDDMERALRDIQTYTGMWDQALTLWHEIQGRQDEILKSSKYDVEAMLDVGRRNGGLLTIGVVSAKLGIANTGRIASVLSMAVHQGRLTIAAPMGEQGSLTDAEYAGLKPRSGPSPQVFRLVIQENNNNYDTPISIRNNVEV